MHKEYVSHINRLEKIVLNFGIFLGLDYTTIKKLVIGATNHDIGKKHIPNEIVYKKGRLSEDEYNLIKKHPINSFSMLMNKHYTDEDILNIALLHHERIDGKGYPFGLKGDEIPKLSRIMSICDSFEAMTADRCYKKPMSSKEAMVEIQNNLGTQFDVVLGQRFIEFMSEKKTVAI